MSKSERSQIKSWVAAGVIDAAFGAFLVKKNKTSRASSGGIALAAILGSVEAREKAKETKIPLVVEEDSVLYEVSSSGKRKLIKHLSREERTLSKKFTL